MFYVLLYDYVEDMPTKRGPYREQHLALAHRFHQQGHLLMAGAWNDPVDGAALVFRTEDSEVIREFVASDPDIQNGLVTRWRIREWNVVVGTS
jgi:uncharacterized protein YciI